MKETRPAEEARPVDGDAGLTNFEKINRMSDVELTKFLWAWKVNSISSFMSDGGREQMDASQILAWLRSKKWDCRETDTFFMEYIPPFDEK